MTQEQEIKILEQRLEQLQKQVPHFIVDIFEEKTYVKKGENKRIVYLKNMISEYECLLLTK